MGGKSKQSQRTKNNVRPSSSARSAELLSGGMSLDAGLMSLASGKPLPPLFPTLAAANLEQGLNPEFQMCIKKLNKKDPITRAKALHELCELVNTSDVEDVVAVLPSWAHFYKILTADTDRKVREMTQVCHGAVVRVCGRRTAPQLKALLPAWLQAQYDDHAPAQAQAHLSLTSTFPDSKLPEVISFCKAEVMTHLLDNLNGNTEAIVSKRIEDAEERQLVMSRITTSSLQGLQYFCLHLPAAHDAWLWEQLLPLLQAAGYWKLAQGTPQVRAAWYGATGRVAERYGAASGAALGARALRELLAAARAPAAPAAAGLWTCLLQLMHNIPDWHTYLDKKELLVKRILDLLENGGWGDARHLSNMLLPLLAYLPQDILTKDFYEAFFNAVFTGLEKKNILISKSERQSWITSLAECLRYLSIQQNDFVLEIVSSVHRTWLANVLSTKHDGQTRTNLIKCSATNMASLVKYWLKQSKEENSEKYDQLVRNFWQNVGSTVLTQIDKSGTDHNEIGKLIEGHILLLQTLKTSFSQELKKQHSIKFDGDAITVTEKSALVMQQCDASVVERYNHNLEDVAQKICSHYLHSAEKKQMSSAIVTPLITLLVEFDNKQLFTALAKQFDVDSVYRLYDKVLRSWLSGDTMRCKTVVDIVFLLMKYMTEEEQDAMFNTFQQFPPGVVEWCVSASVRHPHARAPAARRWLRGACAGAAAARLARRRDAPARALLLACLTGPGGGKVVEWCVSASVRHPHARAPAARRWLRGACAGAAAARLARRRDAPARALLLACLTGPGGGKVVEWCVSASVRHPHARAPAARRWLRGACAGAAAARLARRRDAPARALLLACLTGPGGGKVVEWCVSASVRHPHARAPAARRWLRGACAGAAAARLARRRDAPARALLLACLTGPGGELLVSEDSVSEVLKIVTGAISQPHSGTLEASGALAARLATSLQEHAGQHYALLVLQLFRLNILVPRGDSRLSVDTWCEIRSSWQDGLTMLPDAERTRFLQQAAAFLHEQLFQTMENLDVKKIENIVSLCPHLFSRCDDAEAPDDVTDIAAFTKQIFNMQDPETPVVESYALRHECVTCQLNCLYDDDNDVIATVVRDSAKSDVKELTKTDLLLYVNKHLFRAIYLRTLLLHNVNSGYDDEEPSEHKTWCDVLLKDEYVQREFCNVLYTYVVINSLHEGYAFWPHYDIIVETKQKLDSLLIDVISATSQELRCAIKSTVSELALAKGYFWAYAHRWYTLHAEGKDEKDILEGQKLEDIVSGNGYFHSLQASTKWSSECDSETAYKIKYLVMLRSWYIAFGERGDADLVRDVTRCRDRCDLDVVVNAYYKHNHTMLYDKDITDCPWSSVVSNVAVLDFLTAMVTSRGWEAQPSHWDFATISLCSLLTSVRKSMRSWGSTKMCMLARSALRLWAAVAQFAGAVPREAERRAPPAHVAALADEWRDIFRPDTTYNLFSIVMHVLDSCGEGETTGPQIEVLGELIACSSLLEWDALAPAHARGAHALAGLARGAARALRARAHPAAAQLAYRLLRALGKPLVLDDAEKLKLWSEANAEGDEELPRPQLSLDHLHDAFVHLHDIVDAALSSVVLGEGTCEFVALSDTYKLALGWLLLADAQAALCRLARGDLAQHYAQAYRERGYAEPLVTATLRLLPDAVFAFASDSAGAAPAPPAAQLFLSVASFSVHEPARGADVGALACRALYRAVCGPGTAAARGWWGAAPARAARLLERVVVAYVAPPAAREQLAHLHERAHEVEDAEIRIAWSSNEVTCVYNVEERLIELRVWLARAHPLVAPRLAAPHAQGPGANTHWVALYLSYQNGSLLNALKMWTRAVSARVEAAPQCYICYCRLHPASGRLPRVLCYQCKNKFHTVCLRKWFATSNKSNCPLCRSAF